VLLLFLSADDLSKAYVQIKLSHAIAAAQVQQRIFLLIIKKILVLNLPQKNIHILYTTLTKALW